MLSWRKSALERVFVKRNVAEFMELGAMRQYRLDHANISLRTLTRWCAEVRSVCCGLCSLEYFRCYLLPPRKHSSEHNPFPCIIPCLSMIVKSKVKFGSCSLEYFRCYLLPPRKHSSEHDTFPSIPRITSSESR